MFLFQIWILAITAARDGRMLRATDCCTRFGRARRRGSSAAARFTSDAMTVQAAHCCFALHVASRARACAEKMNPLSNTMVRPRQQHSDAESVQSQLPRDFSP